MISDEGLPTSAWPARRIVLATVPADKISYRGASFVGMNPSAISGIDVLLAFCRPMDRRRRRLLQINARRLSRTNECQRLLEMRLEAKELVAIAPTVGMKFLNLATIGDVDVVLGAGQSQPQCEKASRRFLANPFGQIRRVAANDDHGPPQRAEIRAEIEHHEEVAQERQAEGDADKVRHGDCIDAVGPNRLSKNLEHIALWIVGISAAAA